MCKCGLLSAGMCHVRYKILTRKCVLSLGRHSHVLQLKQEVSQKQRELDDLRAFNQDAEATINKIQTPWKAGLDSTVERLNSLFVE